MGFYVALMHGLGDELAFDDEVRRLEPGLDIATAHLQAAGVGQGFRRRKQKGTRCVILVQHWRA